MCVCVRECVRESVCVCVRERERVCERERECVRHTNNNLEHGLTLDGCSLDSSSSVRNLGVLFDSNLSFDSHVSSICKIAFFILKIYLN